MDIKNGVGPSKVFIKNTEKSHVYLIDFLVEKFPQIPKEEWLKRMDQGLVLDEEGILGDENALLGVAGLGGLWRPGRAGRKTPRRTLAARGRGG